MIPDKIYIQKEGGKTITLNKVHDTDIEYIRKAALIEWAKENQENCFSVVEDDLWQEVIDKIQEL